jgi:hypothetical protein
MLSVIPGFCARDASLNRRVFRLRRRNRRTLSIDGLPKRGLPNPRGLRAYLSARAHPTHLSAFVRQRRPFLAESETFLVGMFWAIFVFRKLRQRATLSRSRTSSPDHRQGLRVHGFALDLIQSPHLVTDTH